MANQVIAGLEVAVDEEGFMTDPGEWSEEIAEALATNIAIDTLTEDHWKVINWLRLHHGRRAHQAVVHAVPQEARQEDVVRIRPAEAQGLCVGRSGEDSIHDHREPSNGRPGLHGRR